MTDLRQPASLCGAVGPYALFRITLCLASFSLFLQYVVFSIESSQYFCFAQIEGFKKVYTALAQQTDLSQKKNREQKAFVKNDDAGLVVLLFVLVIITCSLYW